MLLSETLCLAKHRLSRFLELALLQRPRNGACGRVYHECCKQCVSEKKTWRRLGAFWYCFVPHSRSISWNGVVNLNGTRYPASGVKHKNRRYAKRRSVGGKAFICGVFPYIVVGGCALVEIIHGTAANGLCARSPPSPAVEEA